ncbi:sodium/proton antiporter, CPA1 family (TC 2.A.36) [Caloramator fervidus]|uniref:Sodium/proton antiporter, CPA1 family (TC 2.A.36) n=1 Tax=Caloramator fervidus TaxID=29344 RepID=A0A1H5RKJ8_9CLOT|nr:sodium:proton antiporter [Caloramator fervidus]SEF38614.1 sodium/proton antiporter, CPA1 family (TC 2.A.36) [Caloramator fervidus]
MEAVNLIGMFAAIIFAGLIFTKLSRIVNLPDVVMFILAGIILGPYGLNLINIDKYPLGNELILTFGAAYILYDGGREIDFKVLRKVKWSVISLATIGVIISAFLTGFFAMKIFKIDFIYALLLGSVISSTDPSVLVPLFKSLNVSDKLKQTIISESAFNDAAGAIITFAVLNIITKGTFSLGHSAFELIKTSLGGIIIGAIIGYIATFLVGHKKYAYFEEHPSEIAIAAVAGAYVIATKLGVSGFMAVFVIGMICGNKRMFDLYIPDEYYVTHTRFKEVTTLILRMMIFILLGTHINFALLLKYWKEALLVVAVLIFIARPVSVFFSIIFDKNAEWNFKEIIYMMWVRETGVIPAALSGMLLTMKVPHADIISAVTFATIIITLTLQASSAKWLAKVLKIM